MNTFDNINFAALQEIISWETRRIVVSDREDVQQTILEKLLRKIDSAPTYVSTERQLGGLCRDIARKTVIDYFRHINTKKVSNTWSTDFTVSGSAEQDDWSAELFSLTAEEGGYAMAEILRAYEESRKVFTPQERRVIERKLTEDGMEMSWAEISAELGINKSHASRAKSKFYDVVFAS
jgi:DNA-directed RNA polymerase specialized sigma24 family protein